MAVLKWVHHLKPLQEAGSGAISEKDRWVNRIGLEEQGSGKLWQGWEGVSHELLVSGEASG